MEFRKTNHKDVEQVMEIIKQSQQYFKDQGIDQWQNGYPNEDVIKEDISNDHSYVLLKDNKILATTVLSFDGEETYNEIHDGKWLSNDDYAVIHRIAVNTEYKGLGLSGEIIKEAEKKCSERNIKSIKVDTHKDNISMQKLLEKNGFKYCGIIYLNDGDTRVAFEKIL